MYSLYFSPPISYCSLSYWARSPRSRRSKSTSLSAISLLRRSFSSCTVLSFSATSLSCLLGFKPSTAASMFRIDPSGCFFFTKACSSSICFSSSFSRTSAFLPVKSRPRNPLYSFLRFRSSSSSAFTFMRSSSISCWLSTYHFNFSLNSSSSARFALSRSFFILSFSASSSCSFNAGFLTNSDSSWAFACRAFWSSRASCSLRPCSAFSCSDSWFAF
mmetsp:Transcript_17830/g.44597  ORF Transcript_17830/g.44597 Transcript_17830/m.44597 type:complete len:217 (+) Transcript_17830:2449-3099(+)